MLEETFKTQIICKYAHVYMAQSISKNVPAFCLHAWEVLIALQLKMF